MTIHIIHTGMFKHPSSCADMHIYGPHEHSFCSLVWPCVEGGLASKRVELRTSLLT